jgi:prevent-host-death family protein
MVQISWKLEAALEVSITEAKGQLNERVRRAEAGDGVVLTRHGKATVRLVPVSSSVPRDRRRAVMEAARRSAMASLAAGPDAARSQDFLYGDDGLPR